MSNWKYDTRQQMQHNITAIKAHNRHCPEGDYSCTTQAQICKIHTTVIHTKPSTDDDQTDMLLFYYCNAVTHAPFFHSHGHHSFSFSIVYQRDILENPGLHLKYSPPHVRCTPPPPWTSIVGDLAYVTSLTVFTGLLGIQGMLLTTRNVTSCYHVC